MNNRRKFREPLGGLIPGKGEGDPMNPIADDQGLLDHATHCRRSGAESCITWMPPVIAARRAA